MTISAENFLFVADLVRKRSAIQLGEGKEYLVESRLLALSRAAGAADVNAYVQALRFKPNLAAFEAITEALTTNETSWFRDAQPFEALTGHVVPTLLAEGAGPRLRMWSAACSSGQEPYSIVMAMAEKHPTVQVSIVATDLSEEMVRRTREGRYSQLEVNRGLPVTMLVKHFTRSGADWQVSQPVRSAVTVQRHNLLDAPPLGGPYDVVFLRNVLIYFDAPTKAAILRRVQQVLRPGGFLLLGAAETTIGIDNTWERVAAGRGSVYRSTHRRTA